MGSRGCWPGGKEGAEAAGCTLSPEGRGRKSSVGRRRPQGRLMWPHVVSRILRRSGGAPGGHLHMAAPWPAKWTWCAMGVSQVVTYQHPVSIGLCDPPTNPVTTGICLPWVTHLSSVTGRYCVTRVELADWLICFGRERKCVSLMWPISLCSLTSVMLVKCVSAALCFSSLVFQQPHISAALCFSSLVFHPACWLSDTIVMQVSLELNTIVHYSSEKDAVTVWVVSTI